MSQDIYVIIEHLQGQVADISYVMLGAANKLSQIVDGQVIAVLLGNNAQMLASDLKADKVKYYEHPALTEFTSDAYQKVLAKIIREDSPHVVLFGNTSIGSDLASVLSARLDIPLISSCLKFNDEGKFVCQICGGKIMTEGALPTPSVLITMIPGGYKSEEGQSSQTPDISSIPVDDLEELRVKLIDYIEPEVADVDIAAESVLVSVGRGIQTEDNIELAEELADLLGGVVSSSRPLVDQGWLPTSRMVGKSGKKVKPNLYLALGISGAPEHVEGIMDSEMIIAVNTDPSAPIFDVAKYGAEVDILDLLEVLIEEIEDIK